jgi:hypothetical protein
MVFYGSETRNAQVAFSNDAQKNGKPQIKKLQSPYNPIGRGFGLHALRNVLAMSGIRVFSAPCQDALSQMNPNMSPNTKVVAGDLIANILTSAASAPLHQLYQWSITTSTPLPPSHPPNKFTIFILRSTFGKIDESCLFLFSQ